MPVQRDFIQFELVPPRPALPRKSFFSIQTDFVALQFHERVEQTIPRLFHRIRRLAQLTDETGPANQRRLCETAIVGRPQVGLSRRNPLGNNLRVQPIDVLFQRYGTFFKIFHFPALFINQISVIPDQFCESLHGAAPSPESSTASPGDQGIPRISAKIAYPSSKGVRSSMFWLRKASSGSFSATASSTAGSLPLR